MILTFYVPSLAREITIDNNLEKLKKKYQKIGKSWHGGIKSIISQMRKLKLLPIIYGA